MIPLACFSGNEKPFFNLSRLLMRRWIDIDKLSVTCLHYQSYPTHAVLEHLRLIPGGDS